MFCPQCGANNPDGAKFCTSCGASLDAPEPPASTSEPPAQQPADSPQPAPAPEAAPAADQVPAPPVDQAAAQPWPQPVGADQQAAQQPPAAWPEAPQPDSQPADQTAQQPPQAWPEPPAGQEGQEGKKKSKKGLVIGVVVGVVVLAAAVVGILFATGVLSLGAADEPAAEEQAAGEGGSDEAAGEERSDESDDKADEKDAGEGAKATGDVPIADFGIYDQSPAGIEASLEDLGFSFSRAGAFEATDYSPATLYAYFDGRADEDLPGMDSTQVEVCVSFNLSEDANIQYDEDGYSNDAVASLADLPEDCEVYSIDISYESAAEKGEFGTVAAEIMEAFDLGDAKSISASDQETLDAAAEALGVDAGSDGVEDGYVGDVLYVHGTCDFMGSSGSWSLSLMGGSEFSNTTLVTLSVMD